MKHSFLLLFLNTLTFISLSQNGENPLPYFQQEPKYDVAPTFPGGEHAMMKYFRDSTIYPEPEKTKLIQGYVSLKFYITKKGKIINIQLLNGVPGGPNLAKEAVRLTQNMPEWIPAFKNGKKVETEYIINIPFNFNN